MPGGVGSRVAVPVLRVAMNVAPLPVLVAPAMLVVPMLGTWLPLLRGRGKGGAHQGQACDTYNLALQGRLLTCLANGPRITGGTNGGSAMKAQYWYWVAGAVALLMALLSGVAENRRSRRESLDDIGWVPWRGVQVVAVFAMLLILFFALKVG
jgi:hypothetical protein